MTPREILGKAVTNFLRILATLTEKISERRLALMLLERPFFFFPELGGIFAIKRSVGSHLDKALTGFDKSLHLLMFFSLFFLKLCGASQPATRQETLSCCKKVNQTFFSRFFSEGTSPAALSPDGYDGQTNPKQTLENLPRASANGCLANCISR